MRTKMEQEGSASSVSSCKTRHKRSLSDSCKRNRGDKLDVSAIKTKDVRKTEEKEIASMEERTPIRNNAPISLKQEIQELEKKLQDQFSVRRALEKALGQKSSDLDSSPNHNNNTTSLPNQTKELIKEITILELQVIYLEQHLLSLYRKAFKKELPNITTQTGHVQSTQPTLPRSSYTGPSSMRLGRSHSSLLNRSSRVSPAEKNISSARVLKPCFTSPLTFVEEKEDKMDASSMISLADHLGTKVLDHITLTPNKLSEELLRCMCTIYHKIKSFHNNSGTKTNFSSTYSRSYSPCSSFSSMSLYSSQNLTADIWSPKSKRENCSEIIAGLDETSRHFSGLLCNSFPCNSCFEVSSLCMEGCGSAEIEDLLQNYKLLIQRLEKVDPTGLKNEEKLAFWINIHNSMIMHAHLEKGIPPNNKRRLESLNKISYLIKGQRVNMEMIQTRILGCSKAPSSQWLKLLLYRRLKSKDNREEWQSSPVDQTEPLLHFALCSGSHSDPAVRIYNPKRLYNQLENAKEEYIVSKINIQKENKILLPRLIESYAKDANLNTQEILEMVERYLPQSFRVILQNYQQGRSRKIVEWIPHDFTFRYLVSRDATNFQTI